ncbi:aspartyl protease family protein [Sphingobium sp.]|uniref:aspartyl protease family protein n=1 Tax=Sphingobium sp. TaxID=1912891 RepID=UPI00257D4029|nr:aspartyl protease family protein [Sphingobium sp.]
MSRMVLVLFACLLVGAATAGEARPPLVVPFDFSKSAIEVDVTLKGKALHMILDTGVDPSVIDLAEAEMLGVEIDRGNGGEASGFGDGKGATAFPAKIDKHSAGRTDFPPFRCAGDRYAGNLRGAWPQARWRARLQLPC